MPPFTKFKSIAASRCNDIDWHGARRGDGALRLVMSSVIATHKTLFDEKEINVLCSCP